MAKRKTETNPIMKDETVQKYLRQLKALNFQIDDIRNKIGALQGERERVREAVTGLMVQLVAHAEVSESTADHRVDFIRRIQSGDY